MDVWWLVSLLTKPWLAGAMLALVTTISLASRHLRFRQRTQSSKQKTLSPVVTDQKLVTAAVLQVLPVHSSNGWILTEISHGLRVFSRPFTSLVRISDNPSNSSLPALAASLVLAIPVKKALSLTVNTKELPCWMYGFPASNPRVIVSGSRHSASSEVKDDDLIQFTGSSRDHHTKNENSCREVLNKVKRRVAGFAEKYAPFLDGYIKTPSQVATETLERKWHSENGLSFIFMAPRSPSSLPHHWSLLLFTTLKEPGVCLATMIMLPRDSKTSDVISLLASQLCALREHVELKKLKVYSSNQRNFSSDLSTNSPPLPTSAPPLVNNNNNNLIRKQTHSQHSDPSVKPPLPRTEKHGPQPQRQVVENRRKRNQTSNTQHKSSPRTHRIQSEPATLQPSDQRAPKLSLPSDPALSSTTHQPPSPRLTQVQPQQQPESSSVVSDNPLDVKYASLAWEKSQNLVEVANGSEQDGWHVVGTTKNVFVMKKPPMKGEAPVNSVKGRGIVNVPPEFAMRLLKDPAHTVELDDLLKETRVIHEITDAVHLVQLLYKAVWPTSPRDISCISIGGQLDSNTWISAGVSVEDPRMPPEKGYVRAHLVTGGYVICSIPDNPESCEVTYSAQVDLKGNIPAFAQNKIAESQPMCVNRLRNLAERLYAEMKQNPQKLREFEDSFPIPKILPNSQQGSSVPVVAPDSTEMTISPFQTGEAEPGSRRHDTVLATEQPPASPTYSSGTPTHPDHESLHYQTGDGLGESEMGGVMEEDETVREDKTFEFHTPSVQSENEDDVIDTSTGIPPSVGIRIPSNGTTEDEQNARSVFQFQTPSSLENTFPIAEDFDKDPPHTNGTDSGSVSTDDVVFSSGGGSRQENGQIVMESLEAYTPEEIPSDPEVEMGEEQREDKHKAFVLKKSPSLALKLPPYPRLRSSSGDSHGSQTSLTKETLSYPRTGAGVDYRTMANQTAARVLEEIFQVGNLDLSDPSTFTDQANGWRFAGLEKDVLILSKKTADSPFASFMGKGIINLAPQVVFDSIRNPQLRYTYDNMLKELHIVKQIDEGLYILHLHHETTQCFVKQSRDFCILVSERSEPNKMLLVGTSIDVPECPVNPNLHRGKIFCSGWVMEPYRAKGQLQTEITYLLQVDIGGLPSTLVNFVSKRQPLAVAYLRDYLTATSLELSAKENK